MSFSINITQFLEKSVQIPIIDVRTPAEFEKGNIPGAFNLPLFSNEERIIVGTLYKQQGRDSAIRKGLDLVRPKLNDLINHSQAILEKRFNPHPTPSSCYPESNRSLLVHCWRGGMRSGSVAWLLELYGYKVYTLKGGYKFFRQHVLASFNKPYKLIVLGGRTGSAKTLILQQLADLGEQIIDLEKLAHHKGSSFGAIGEQTQPTQEQFENNLASTLQQLNATKPIWVEDESRLIGKKVIPSGLWEQMRSAQVIYIDVPFQKRATYLTQEYGAFNKDELADSIKRITKRLGGEQTKLALEALENNDLKKACEICLIYYDQTYDYGLSKRVSSTIKKFTFENTTIEQMASVILSSATHSS